MCLFVFNFTKLFKFFRYGDEGAYAANDSNFRYHQFDVNNVNKKIACESLMLGSQYSNWRKITDAEGGTAEDYFEEPHHVNYLPFIYSDDFYNSFDPELGRDQTYSIYIRTQDLSK
jgi:hypothetical protein